MKKRGLSGFFLFICLDLIRFSPGSPTSELESSIVKTDTGYVSGTITNGIREYRGIPYASPPVGDLRWKPPKPALPWEGVKQTREFGAVCPQLSARDPLTGEIYANMSEDCLYLNVWTPAKQVEEKLPVMVFIHGGAFHIGAGSLQLYNGTALAQKGVVVVTINYRLGVLGFFSHPLLAEESFHHSSGNYGLLDQIAALEWVNRNIGAFGGDPSRVTIFGESSGGTSIIAHLVNPQTRGLYQQAIIESGLLWSDRGLFRFFIPKSVAEQKGEEYARSLGCADPETIAQMRKISTNDLLNTTTRFFPVIDGWLIPKSPDSLIRQKKENPVPLIIGTNSDEGTLLVPNVNLTVREYQNYIHDLFGKDAEEILAKYQVNSPDEVRSSLERIITEYEFSDAAKLVAGSISETNRNTYLYRYSYVLPGQSKGAFHGSELFMVFRPSSVQLDPQSSAVSERIMDLWVRFAKTGDPNGGMNGTWPRYTSGEGRYLEINTISEQEADYS